ncbi:MAG: BatD family protein [Paludibacteraceae bacterium]|nr:BatD family protein [Paludibacteraceae bacterium]
MKHRLFLGLVILLSTIHYPLSTFAEDVTFTASAPSQVVINRPFQLTYTVNTKAKNLRQPDWSPFDVLAGPYTSQSQSTSFVNGTMSSSFTLTYTFTLMSSQEGTFTIAPATITAEGDEYRSNGLKITVLPADEQPTSNSSNKGDPQSSIHHPQSTDNTQDCFIRTIVSKTSVTEQEPIYLYYKLYFANVDIAQFTNNIKIPEYTGFLKQELENGEIQTELEHYNGRNYQTAVLYKTVLYPQRSGDIKIDPASFEAVLRVQTHQQVRSIFDDFFGSYTNVNRTLTAPGTTIHVNPLPSGKPADFSGAVGKFNLSHSLSPESGKLKVNEALTIKLDISGSGNMKLIKTPAIDWPEGFEPYDPKVTNNFRTTTSGTSGTKSIEYLAIPRAAGEYLIPAIHFSYFDTSTGQYKTLSTPEYTLHITRDGNSLTASESSNDPQSTIHTPQSLKEDIKHLGTDIRYIHTAESPTAKRSYSEAVLQRSGLTARSAVLSYLLPLILAIIIFFITRHLQRENANVVHVRYKKANKVAQKRLKAAKTALAAANYSMFYEAVEQAAWQYLSDRLSIPTASLNRENIDTILQEKNVTNELIASVDAVLTAAQMARYTASMSSNPAADAEALYNQTVTLINNLENQKI